MRTNAMTIRAATSADAGAIRRLAAFSSARPRGPAGGEHDGTMIAAIAVSSGRLSNPARVAADAVRRLRRRGYQLLRQNGDIGAARALLRRLAPTPLAA